MYHCSGPAAGTPPRNREREGTTQATAGTAEFVDVFARHFLAVYFTGVALFYTLRVILGRARRGSSPVRKRTVEGRINLPYAAFRAAIWAA